jgi:hypothetical protein
MPAALQCCCHGGTPVHVNLLEDGGLQSSHSAPSVNHQLLKIKYPMAQLPDIFPASVGICFTISSDEKIGSK